jgi:hypothetical protein|tara:strand:- start:2686 stop:2826 length:141 start_codon:yes stop_codon:yes gene_type:complete
MTANMNGFKAGFVYSLTDNFHLMADYAIISIHLEIDYANAGIRLNF